MKFRTMVPLVVLPVFAIAGCKKQSGVRQAEADEPVVGRMCFEPTMPTPTAPPRQVAAMGRVDFSPADVNGLNLVGITPEVTEEAGDQGIYLKSCKNNKECFDGVIYGGSTSFDPRFAGAGDLSLRHFFLLKEGETQCPNGEIVYPTFMKGVKFCAGPKFTRHFENALTDDGKGETKRKALSSALEKFQEGQALLLALQGNADVVGTNSSDEKQKAWFLAFAQLGSELPRVALSAEYANIRKKVQGQFEAREKGGLQLTDKGGKTCADADAMKNETTLKLSGKVHPDLDFVALLTLGSMAMDRGFTEAGFDSRIKRTIERYADWGWEWPVAYGSYAQGMEWSTSSSASSRLQASPASSGATSGWRRFLNWKVGLVGLAVVGAVTAILVTQLTLADGPAAKAIAAFREDARKFGKTYDALTAQWSQSAQ